MSATRTISCMYLRCNHSGRLKEWPRSRRLSTEQRGGNKWCKQCCDLHILLNRSSSVLSNNSRNLSLSRMWPNLFKRRNRASSLPLNSADRKPPMLEEHYKIRDTIKECATTLSFSIGIPWCFDNFSRYIRWAHCDRMYCI